MLFGVINFFYLFNVMQLNFDISGDENCFLDFTPYNFISRYLFKTVGDPILFFSN